MADRIQLLPEVVANQIAAGEVVNRPASVVKEMMENAIDAGASCVKVNFRDGGKELIQIVDDGCGMSALDARMAFDRHATSKIRSVEDIYRLHTFGFRGEALASIAAVAQVELRTRQAEDELGTVTEIHGGAFLSQQPVVCPVGSQFFVRNLFFNVPARRRFLEKSTTSAKQIKSEFQRVALCHPEVAFELYANDAPIYQLPVASLATRIVDLMGRSIKQNLLEVDASTSIASIKGYIGRPAAAKQRNQEQYLFVNGRYFKSPHLVSAILRGYEKLIPQTAQPSYFLFLEIDPSRIDVNIHPQKTEVKFADEEAVWQIVNAAVRETLAKSGVVPMMDFDLEQSVDIPVAQHGVLYGEPSAVANVDYNPFSDSYIDPSAPDPNMDYRGFDVPYTGAAERSVLSDSGVSAPSMRVSSPRASLGFSVGEEEFDDFRSMASEELTAGFTMPASEPFEEEFVEIASGGEQQRLEMAVKPDFRNPIAVGGALAVVMGEAGALVVDLRRAQERILFEDYTKMARDSRGVSQQLLFPEEVVFSKEEFALLVEHEVELASLGFDLSFEADEHVVVRGLPADMAVEELDAVLYELVTLFAEPGLTPDRCRERTAALLAASGARRLPKVPHEAQLRALLDRLAEVENYSFSPAGKPIVAPLSVEELRAKLT
ncbi:MAG: DNA mismatch repair endonuclease MutL [Alistipes sp.]|nr:DNA mismatch repair endonuclease MutL [Alistipes sp.]